MRDISDLNSLCTTMAIVAIVTQVFLVAPAFLRVF